MRGIRGAWGLAPGMAVDVRLRHQLSVLRRQLGPDGARFTPADNQALLARCSTGSRTGPRESRMGVSPNDLGLGE